MRTTASSKNRPLLFGSHWPAATLPKPKLARISGTCQQKAKNVAARTAPILLTILFTLTSLGVGNSSTAANVNLFSSELGYPAINDICRTPAAIVGVNENCLDRTVPGTGTAFHATVVIHNLGLFVLHGKDTVGTDRCTVAATNAGLFVQFEDGSIVNISKIFHIPFSS